MSTLSLRGVTKRYPAGRRADGAEVLRGVDLDVRDGELCVLVGPSGCGKSTLLRIVAGLTDATAGEVILDGRRVDGLEPAARDVAMVFQSYALYPHMSVRANLAFPLRLARVPRAERERRVAETAELLGIADLLGRKPTQLSGGQMQRVALGRAIVRRPRLFLFDEPLSNLDANLRAQMRRELRALHERLGITSLYVTHDQAEALTMGSRICVMHAGEVLQVDAPLAVFERPATRFVAGFIGAPPMSLLVGTVRRGRFACGPLAVDCPVPGEGPRVLGVRPGEVTLARGRGGAEGELSLPVRAVEALGTTTHVALTVGEGGAELAATLAGSEPPPRVGERVGISLTGATLHWFDAVDGRRLEAGPLRDD